MQRIPCNRCDGRGWTTFAIGEREHSETCRACSGDGEVWSESTEHADANLAQAEAHDAIERPYRCEGCAGRGVMTGREWVDGLLVDGARRCKTCKGRGALSRDEALAAFVDAAHLEIRYGAHGSSPRVSAYVAQAEAIGDARLGGLWQRICQRIDALTRRAA